MGGRYLTARRAAEELGVSLPTLYAYVSRGLVRSEAGAGRSRRYREEDVRHLRERKERRRDPSRAAEDALHWGTPVLESALTLVSGGRLYYRGKDAVALAGGWSLERVAALLWTRDSEDARALFEGGANASSRPAPDGVPGVSKLEPLGRFQALLPLAAPLDPAAYDLRPRAVARTGSRILHLLARTAAPDGREAPEAGVAGVLQRGWVAGEPGAGNLINAALVLCADHELPVSTFAARCVASSGATPYAVVAAGLHAMGGVRHGGMIELAEVLLGEVEASGDARGVLTGRLRRGEGIPGFGHSLYPGGDPRGVELLRLCAETYPGAQAVALADEVCGAALEVVGERPTVDLGLTILARTLDLPPGSAVALFALGRTVGWIGHAIEQYEGGTLIRPRARYVGEQPPVLEKEG